MLLRWFLSALLLTILLGFPSPQAPAQIPKKDSILAFKVGRIYPVSKPAFDDAVLLVQDGKILEIGPADQVKIPEGAIVQELPDAVIIPGLVDTHSHIGIYPRPGVQANSDGNEMTGPVQPGLRAIDAIQPDDPGIPMAVGGGVTTANIMPGSGNAIGGATLYVKLRGNTVEAMRIVDPKTVGGLKMANGENPKGYGRRGQAPFTRMKVAALQREQFLKAKEYQAKWAAYRQKKEKGEAGPAPDVDLNLEQLVEVLERKRTVHFHCHRADDLLTAVRIAEEFNFEIVLQHATEGYRVVEELVKKKIPVSLTLIDSPGGKAETIGLLEENAAVLQKAGVKVAINTDDSVTESRFYLRTGSIAVRGGMSEEEALKALTLTPAELMHLDHRIGSLDKGKEADFVVLSGRPFSSYTMVLQTYIDGKKEFDRSSKRDWAYQAGGFSLRFPNLLPDPPKPFKPLVAVKAPGKSPETLPPQPKVIRAGRIHIGNGEMIANGVIVIENGKIKAVGPSDQVAVPKDATVVFATEVTPGMIDAHCSIGLSGAWNIPADQDQDEPSDPNQADLRAIDGFNPNEPLLEFMRANGVTLVHSTPGRVNVIAGQTGVFRTAGSTVDSMTVKFPAGILVNLGESSKGAQGKAPMTRMGSASLLRNALTAAKNHQAKLTSDKDKAPPKNLKAEGFLPMLEGKAPVIFAAHRSDDLLTALRIAEEFKLKPMLSLASEAYLIRDEIAKAKVPVIVHPTMQRAASSMETLHASTVNAMQLSDKQIPIAICTGFEGYVPKSRMLRVEAGIGMAHGLGHQKALKAVTLDAAKILGVDDKYGSIEVGKVADLVLYDGDPLENATHVEATIMDGKVVYSRSEYLKIPFARRILPYVNGTGGGGDNCCLGW